jgi:hypothetical protein
MTLEVHEARTRSAAWLITCVLVYSKSSSHMHPDKGKTDSNNAIYFEKSKLEMHSILKR